MIKKRIGISLLSAVLFCSTLAFASECFDANIAVIQKQIECDLRNYQREWDKTASIFHANAIFPACSTIKGNQKMTGVFGTSGLTNAMIWIHRSLSNWLVKEDSLIVLQKMKHGDDWIIGFGIYQNKYAQFIDGRTLTVVIEDSVDICDSANFDSDLIRKISRFIHLSAFGNQTKLVVKTVKRDSVSILGEITDTSTWNIEIAQKKVDMFWTNGKYIVVDIMKIRNPFKDRTGFRPEYTIGGIGHLENRPFIRFDQRNKFDFKTEMYIQFPWVKDTINAWKKQNHENDGIIGGLTPTYILAPSMKP
jgi:hypothetical protein